MLSIKYASVELTTYIIKKTLISEWTSGQDINIKVSQPEVIGKKYIYIYKSTSAAEGKKIK